MAYRALPDAAAARPGTWARAWCRSWPTRRAPSAWRACSARSASTTRQGQQYTPVDKDQVMYYKEDKAGQILQEGINEAGGMRQLDRGGHVSYSTQRPHHDAVLHLLLDVRLPAHRRPGLGRRRHAARAASCWAAPPGRTTLNGEGLQHEDGHSHMLAGDHPQLRQLRPDLRATRWR